MRKARWWAAALASTAVLLLLLWIGGGDDEPQPRLPADPTPTAPSASVSRCVHPYTPTSVGSVLEYHWQGPRASASVMLSLIDAREQGDGAALTWRADTTTDALGQVSFTLDRRCDEDGAQEPWVALGIPPRVQLRAQTWLLPRALRPGVGYQGTMEIVIAGFTTTLDRRHTVHDSERLDVRGHSYEAIRIAIEEHTTGGGGTGRSTAWIARDIGLVRLERGPAEHRETYELVSATIAR